MENLKEEISYLKEENKKLEKKLSLLRSLIRAIQTSSMDRKKILDFTLDLAISTLEAEAGSIIFLNEEKQEIYFETTRGEKAELIKKYKLKIGEGIAGWVIESGLPTSVSEANKDERFKYEISRLIDYPTYSILCVPLRKQNKVFGAIELLNKKRAEEFTEEDEHLLSLIADEMVIGLENANLLNQAQRKILDFTALIEVSTLITSSLNLNTVLNQIMEVAGILMNTEASSLMLYDEEKNDLVFEVAKGEKGEEAKKFRLKLGQGIAGWVAEEKRPLLIPDAY
jgi:signal transduction protein with GAF and PtsI domain